MELYRSSQASLLKKWSKDWDSEFISATIPSPSPIHLQVVKLPQEPKNTTQVFYTIRKPGTQKSMENCAFFLAIFSAQPGPTNRFLETLHGSSSRFALPFLPSRSCSGWVVFSETSLTTLPCDFIFWGLKELHQLTQKGVWKDGFFPTCRFFCWVMFWRREGQQKQVSFTRWSKVSKADLTNFWNVEIDERL